MSRKSQFLTKWSLSKNANRNESLKSSVKPIETIKNININKIRSNNVKRIFDQIITTEFF